MFERGVYLSVFNYACYVKVMSADFSEEQVSEERDPDLNGEEDTRLDEIKDENSRDVYEECDNKKKIHTLRLVVYVKYKYEFINRGFLVFITHLKGWEPVWTCVEDNIIEEEEN